MRFAYIDSQGNEIAVSSVDALGLRIELGAIGPDTPLYDARTDRWGPAKTHEVFHTLARMVTPGGELPTVLLPDFPEDKAPPRSPPEPARPPRSEAYFDLTGEVGTVEPRDETESVEQRDRGPKAAPAALTPQADVGGSPEDLALELTFVDVVPASPELTERGDLALPPPEAERQSPESIPAEELAPADLSSLNELELEPPLGEMDFSQAQAAPLASLDLEPPLTEAPVGPVSGGGATPEEEPLDLSPASAPEEAPLDLGPASDAPLRPGRRRSTTQGPRSRPSPPRRMRSRPSTGMVIGSWTLLVAVGYLGWQALRSVGGAPEPEPAEARPPVTLPDLPADLLPIMRELGEAALATTVAELRGLEAEVGLPPEPREDWLAGVYMANASRFADVEEYWRLMGTWVRRVREADGRIFRARFAEALRERGIEEAQAELLQARADSGFLATAPERQDAYGQMESLVSAALDLHRFLLENESRIAYEPATGGVSSDPVLEAVPVSTELGDRMWDMVDRITGSLDALGTLDRVTTDRLTTVLLDRILSVGIR